eukprot:Nitzschia sp. Nitz4//scaffold54_size114964//46556//47386//NITZ4_003847-RA/size114964-processed-gene-0.64-mRNA-1//-1//CDS//3329554339//5230//frame0
MEMGISFPLIQVSQTKSSQDTPLHSENPVQLSGTTLLESSNMLSNYRTSILSLAGRRLKSSSSAVTAASPLTFKLSSFVQNHPFAFQLGISTVKASAADIVAQMYAENKSLAEIDWKRNALFVLFGFSYLGCFQYYLMVHKYRHWFPSMDRFAQLSVAGKLKDTAGIIDAGKMVLFDIIFHIPLMYYPTYYTVKEFVFGQSWNPIDWVQNGVGHYASNLKEDIKAMLRVWLPSDCIQFVLPVYLRLPYRHGVSFFWTAYMSMARGAAEHPGDTEVM